jgi:DNA-binding CsgD family transcriptional regulator
MARLDLHRLDGELERLAERGLDSETFRREAMARLARVVPADGYCLATADPATVVMTRHVTAGVPRGEAWRLYRNEYGEADFSKHSDLARGARPVRILERETEGEPERSPRYRDLIRPMGMGHELRAAAIDNGATWGLLHRYRAVGARGFSADEEAVVARVGRRIAAGIRAASLVVAADTTTAAQSPGMLLLDASGRLRMLSGSAEGLLVGLRDPDVPADAVPDVLITLGQWAHELARRGMDQSTARARVRTDDGAWWLLHASCPTWTDGERSDVVIIIQPVVGADLADMMMRALGFTEGERAVLGLVLRGRSTKEIAGELHLSPWTVQDRLKSIFARAGVRSRRDLVARLTGA